MIDDELTDQSHFGRTHRSALQQQIHEAKNGRKENRSPVLNKNKKLGAAIPVGSRRSLQAVNQELEFFRSQGWAGAIALGPGEGAFLQSFGAHPQTGAIPK